ncbi:MAG: hypothetical protein IPJ66_13655 [Bacteroidetes bacterium]|nr:hypothetical protein [Bacteroidota bacterium]
MEVPRCDFTELADWILSHSESARNAINDYYGAGSDILYFYTLLNNTNGICNNSPSFEAVQFLFACVGQQFCYSNSASDSDGILYTMNL